METTENSKTSKHLSQEPSTTPKITTTDKAVDKQSITYDSAPIKTRGNTEGKPAILRLGIMSVLVGFLLLVSVFFHFPSEYWNQGVGEVRWYKIDGMEVVNGEVQLRLSPVQPEKGDPTDEELTQFAIDFDPAFFTGSLINERIYLDRLPGSKGLGFKGYLFGKLGEKVDISSILAAYEVTITQRTRYGYIIASVIMLLGLILILSGRRKAK
jgi:hypothetical protein